MTCGNGSTPSPHGKQSMSGWILPWPEASIRYRAARLMLACLAEPRLALRSRCLDPGGSAAVSASALLSPQQLSHSGAAPQSPEPGALQLSVEELTVEERVALLPPL